MGKKDILKVGIFGSALSCVGLNIYQVFAGYTWGVTAVVGVLVVACVGCYLGWRESRKESE